LNIARKLNQNATVATEFKFGPRQGMGGPMGPATLDQHQSETTIGFSQYFMTFQAGVRILSLSCELISFSGFDIIDRPNCFNCGFAYPPGYQATTQVFLYPRAPLSPPPWHVFLISYTRKTVLR
jgi:hypothetical protein